MKPLKYAFAAAILVTLPTRAFAAAPSLGIAEAAGGDGNKLIQLIVLLTALSLAPAILMTVTSFTRIVVALSLLRTGLGAPGVPPNPVIISLALFLSFFVMAPTFSEAWENGISPYGDGAISEEQAYERTAAPFRVFMLKQVRDDDLQLFIDLSTEKPESREDIGMTVLAPAFMISELRRAFEIGFVLLLPFLIIDLAVASILMAMGMMMLPPPSISLPCKIIFFVLVDGWSLVSGSLVRSFGLG